MKIAQSLLEHGVNPNVPDAKGRTPLWYAANYSSDKGLLIRKLVQKGAHLPDDVLMGPVHDGDIETVRFLIRHGANVNCIATFTRYSYKFPQKRVLLTEAISNISTHESAERTANAMRAAMTAKQRAKHSPPPPTGDLELIPIMLIKAGAEVNRLAFGYSLYEGFIRTTFGLAAHWGLVRTVKAMLSAGADVNMKDTWGGTALIDAAQQGHQQIVRILLRAGAKVNIKRQDGRTASSIAREHGFPNLADELERLHP